jgi:hypothetical protein
MIFNIFFLLDCKIMSIIAAQKRVKMIINVAYNHQQLGHHGVS